MFFQMSVGDLIWQWRSGLEDVCCRYFKDVFLEDVLCTDSKTKIYFFIELLYPIHFLTLHCHSYWHLWYFENESGTHSFCAGGGVRSSVFWFCSLMCYPLDHGALVWISYSLVNVKNWGPRSGSNLKSLLLRYFNEISYSEAFKGADYESVVKFTKDVQPRVVLARFSLH